MHNTKHDPAPIISRCLSPQRIHCMTSMSLAAFVSLGHKPYVLAYHIPARSNVIPYQITSTVRPDGNN